MEHPLPTGIFVEMNPSPDEFDNWTEEDFDKEIRRLQERIKELETNNAVLSSAAKEVKKIRNSLIAKIELGSRETDENEHENMNKLDILSLLQKYEKKITTSFRKQNKTSKIIINFLCCTK